MNQLKSSLLCVFAFALSASASAQVVNIVVPPVGITPVALNVTGNTTLDLPPDGKLYFTTLTVSGSLSFTPNARNTPVYLLATDDVYVTGTIYVPGSAGTTLSGGAGGPGGFAGGEPGFGSTPGAGHGPGGGAPSGHGSHAVGAAAYGTRLALPLVGGSGGGGGAGGGGGGGGGAIIIASNESINLMGNINATGGVGTAGLNGHGRASGGTVRLVAKEVMGTGLLLVHGPHDGYTAELGRCRVDAIHRQALGVQCYLGGVLVVGSMMQIEPSIMPRLDILQVAGADVDGGSSFSLTLDVNSAAEQPVRIRAQNFFSGSANVRIRLTPSSGEATEIPVPSPIANNTYQDVLVPIPANNNVTIEVYGEETGAN